VSRPGRASIGIGAAHHVIATVKASRKQSIVDLACPVWSQIVLAIECWRHTTIGLFDVGEEELHRVEVWFRFLALELGQERFEHLGLSRPSLSPTWVPPQRQIAAANQCTGLVWGRTMR